MFGYCHYRKVNGKSKYKFVNPKQKLFKLHRYAVQSSQSYIGSTHSPLTYREMLASKTKKKRVACTIKDSYFLFQQIK